MAFEILQNIVAPERLTHRFLMTPYGVLTLGQHWLVYTGSSYGLLPDGTKPLPEPMVIQQKKSCTVTFTRRHFCGRAKSVTCDHFGENWPHVIMGMCVLYDFYFPKWLYVTNMSYLIWVNVVCYDWGIPTACLAGDDGNCQHIEARATLLLTGINFKHSMDK